MPQYLVAIHLPDNYNPSLEGGTLAQIFLDTLGFNNSPIRHDHNK
jgi:hypothetical protein